MKLIEKFKNMFTEEVEEEVKIEKVPTPKKIKKENVPDVVDSFDEVKIEKEEVKKPVFFTDQDFDDLEQKQNRRLERDNNLHNDYNVRDEYQTRSDYEKRSSFHSNYNESRIENQKLETYRGNQSNVYNGNQTNVYNDPYKEKKEERVFKPTPIISPVYGILDKNYHKEDIVSKKEVDYSPVGGVTNIDTVRKKAYGTLEDELENTLFGSNSILFNNKEDEKDTTDDFFNELEQESRPDLLDDISISGNDEVEKQDKKIKDLEEITMDLGKELNSLMNKKEKLKNKEEKKDEDEDDLFNLIDSMYEGDE